MVQMEVCIPVEVEGRYGEFYPGIISGLNSLNELHVHLLDCTHSKAVSELTLAPSALRLPPETMGLSFEPIQGQDVDVLIGSTSDSNTENALPSDSPASKISAWWPGRIKRIGGGFVVVELCSNFSTDDKNDGDSNELRVLPNGRVNVPHSTSLEKTDIVEKHQLRPRSHRPNLMASSFYVHAIDIPDGLAPYCREPAHYQHFARRCGLPVLICMAPESMRPSSPPKSKSNDTYELKARLLIISTEQSTIKRAAVIDNTFIDMLRQKVMILQQTEELSRKIEANRLNQLSLFVEKFSISPDLIYCAFGPRNCNISRANAIDGVQSVKFDRQTCTFHISGRTQEAIRAARDILDFAYEVIQLPRSYVGLILGSNNRNIQHIVDRVGLVSMRISKSPESDQECVSFCLTGTRRSILDARMFLEFHVVGLQELDRLRGIQDPPCIPKHKELVTQTGDSQSPEMSSQLPPSQRGPWFRGPTRRNPRAGGAGNRPLQAEPLNGSGVYGDDVDGISKQRNNSNPKVRLSSNNIDKQGPQTRQPNDMNSRQGPDGNRLKQQRQNYHSDAPRSNSMGSGRRNVTIPTAS